MSDPAHEKPTTRPRRPRVRHDPTLARPVPNERIQQMWEALAALNQHRWLTNTQVSNLLFRDRPNSLGQVRSSAAAVRACNGMCLIRLKDRELISRIPINLAAAGRWALPYPVNVLTAKGRQALLDYAEEDELFARPLTTRLPFHTLDHEVLVRDVAIQFARACERQGWTFEYWQGDEDFESYKATHGGGPAFSGVMMPDGFFLIGADDAFHPHFLEVDLGTETLTSGVKSGNATIKDWATKYARYLEYLPRFTLDPIFAGLPHEAVVLIITTSSRRMAGLRRAALEAGGDDRFRFTTLEAFGSCWPTSATETIWLTPATNQPRSLTERMMR